MTAYADYLRRAAASSPIAEVKQRGADLLGLGPGDRVVDVGCGPGIDTIRYASLVGPTGYVLGVDPDPHMIAAADRAARSAGVQPWVEHRVGAGLQRPPNGGDWDAVHCERVLQHLSESSGQALVCEAAREVRPGGRVVLADTDWATLSVDVPEAELERRLTRLHLARFPNGVAGRQLTRLMRGAGLVELATEFHVLPLDGATLDYLLAPTERWALTAGTLTYAEWWRWRSALTQAMTGGLGHATVLLVLAAATRP